MITKKVNRITKATFKSYVKKHKENLFINVTSKFDPMHDSCMQQYNGFIKATHDCKMIENSLGVNGIYLVEDSKNYFSFYEDDFFTGIKVYNCCGSFIIGVKKT